MHSAFNLSLLQQVIYSSYIWNISITYNEPNIYLKRSFKDISFPGFSFAIFMQNTTSCIKRRKNNPAGSVQSI